MEIVSLAGLGAVALTEGVKFLYSQATEMLRRRRDTKAEAELKQPDQTILNGTLNEQGFQIDKLASVASDLREARLTLADYVDGVIDVTAEDETLIGAITEVRHLLEQIYGQYITFRGETGRPATGTPVTATQLAEGTSRVVNAGGTGAIAIGGDNSGIVRTTVHNP